MSALAGLRLNCLLVPVVLSVVALGATWGIWWLGHEAATTQDQQETAQALAICARLRPDGDPRSCRAADPRWTGLAVLRWHGGKVERRAADGILCLTDDNPHPDLVLAAGGTLAWIDRPGLLAAAAPLAMDAQGERHLLYGERPALVPDPSLPLALSALIIVLGGALGWYLARRIYQPVEWLTLEAESALAGRPRLAFERSSKETAALRSSVITLADRYRTERSSGHNPTAGESTGAPR